MGERWRLLYLVAAMIAVCVVSAGTGIYLPYRAALDQERQRVADAVENQVQLIEAVARFGRARSFGTAADVARQTLEQVIDAHERSRGTGRTGELVLARRVGEHIEFVLSHGREARGATRRATLGGHIAQPMQRALRGETGTMIGLDYRGVPVLAAYRPVPELDLGAVAKIDLAEIRAPYLRALWMGGLGAVGAIVISAYLFVRLTNPLIAQLEESVARQRAVVDTAAEGIITIDQSGVIESINKAAEEIFGYAPGELIGSNVNVLMPSPHAEQHDAYIERYRRTGERRIIGFGREVSGLRKDGTVFPLYVAVSEVRYAGGRLFTGIVRDLTEQKRAAEAVREAQRIAEERARLAEIGAMTAQVVHELGNPLAALGMQGQLIRRRMARGETLEALRVPIENIVANVSRLEAMTHALRGFARGLRLDLRDVDVAAFLGSLVALWRPLAEERAVRLCIEQDLPPEASVVRVDGGQLQRVFENLIKNAIEAINGEPGRVVLRARAPRSDRVRFTVEDNGTGVSDESRLFELFTTTKPDGMGFGLAIAKQIVLAHGGNIWHERASPRGAAFHVEIPTRGPSTDAVAG